MGKWSWLIVLAACSGGGMETDAALDSAVGDSSDLRVVDAADSSSDGATVQPGLTLRGGLVQGAVVSGGAFVLAGGFEASSSNGTRFSLRSGALLRGAR